MNKDEIMDALEDEREKFLDAIDGLPDEALQEAGVVGDWSIKDVMAHLIAWETELIKLLWQAQQGQKPTSAHFGSTSMDDLNAAFYQETRDRPLDRVMADFQAVRKQTSRRVDAFSDADLNNPQRYPWLDGRPLWSWV
ncbi:MAG TPA: ClbS/DfsB family four-helix bundle protein [Anaerolineales bacterium]